MRAARQAHGAILLVLAVLAAIGCIALLWGAKDDYIRLAAAALSGFAAYILARMGSHRRIPVLGSVDALVKLVERHEMPVAIYLRRFVEDARTDHPADHRNIRDSDEEELVAALTEHCLFVAVGRPGEPLPARGAYRLYVADSDWQAVVERLVGMASLIVVRWAQSGPLAWELDLIERQGKLARTLFFLPPPGPDYDVRDFLPERFRLLFDHDSAETHDDAAYAAFFRLTEDGHGVLSFRHRKESLEDATGRVVAESIGIPPLTRSQRRAIRGLYGPIERAALIIGRASVVTFGAVLGLLAVLFLDILTFEILVDLVPIEDLLTPLGVLLAVALALFLLCGLLVTRTVGRT